MWALACPYVAFTYAFMALTRSDAVCAGCGDCPHGFATKRCLSSREALGAGRTSLVPGIASTAGMRMLCNEPRWQAGEGRQRRSCRACEAHIAAQGVPAILLWIHGRGAGCGCGTAGHIGRQAWVLLSDQRAEGSAHASNDELGISIDEAAPRLLADEVTGWHRAGTIPLFISAFDWYEARLCTNNALDFDDLLSVCVALLRDEVRASP